MEQTFGTNPAALDVIGAEIGKRFLEKSQLAKRVTEDRSKPIIMGGDLASGPDHSVAVAMRKEDDGSMRILACEELPPDTAAVVGFTGRQQGKTERRVGMAPELGMPYAVEDDVPLPAPKGSATGRVVMPHGFSETVPRTKSSLVVTILECGPVFVLQARGPLNHVVQFTNERGVVGFASREDAKLFMPDVCAQYWRRYG